jgi:hypothetical protein
MTARRRSRPREDERSELEQRWKENFERRKRERETPLWDEFDRRFAEQRSKVKGWKLEIRGEDVMEVLELAFMLTNNPAYESARKAMVLHRLHKGGLKRRFFRSAQSPPPAGRIACIWPDADDWPNPMTQYVVEEGYGVTRAAEHVVASLGLPGTCFSDAVDKLRKAYAKREKIEAERQRYSNELHGLGEPDDSR